MKQSLQIPSFIWEFSKQFYYHPVRFLWNGQQKVNYFLSWLNSMNCQRRNVNLEVREY